jgi:transcriptional regulator with XRE-family HTH domain/GTPase SAR1 family protein
MFDLRGFRENKLKMTQAQFAEIIGERQDTISRWEQNPDDISYGKLAKIAKTFGTTIDELVGYTKDNPINFTVDNTWMTPEFTKKSLLKYIREEGTAYQNSWGNRYNDQIDRLDVAIKKSIVKPKVAVVGLSDVGKSSLINNLIGTEKLPTAWTPTTSIVVYIKHISDRPSFIENNVWIFRNKVGEETEWNDKRLDDEDYCGSWKLAGGGFDLLKQYGTRQGDSFLTDEAGSAVVFVDSDILKVCDIIDLPGFGTGDRTSDDVMTAQIRNKADVLIYMSHAEQFLNGTAIEFLKSSLSILKPFEDKKTNSLAPLCNLYILASQAHTVNNGNPQFLNDILDKGCERFIRVVPDSVWADRETISGHTYNSAAVRNRFFTYASDMERLRTDFEQDLKKLLEELPKLIDNRAQLFISETVSGLDDEMDNKLLHFREMAKSKEEAACNYDSFMKNEPVRNAKNTEIRNRMNQKVQALASESKSDLSSEYARLFTVDNVADIIKERGFKNNKQGRDEVCSYMSSLLQEKIQHIVKKHSENFSKDVDQYLNDFKSNISSDSTQNFNLNFHFDVTRAFASGLAGLATFGALAFWTSTLGNLGAYILVAKGVSLLSLLGISVGGTAAAATAVASIGGPIVLGIAIAVLAALTMFAIFSGGWRKSLAKKLIEALDKEDALGKCQNNLNQYWRDTKTAFNAAADNLESEWKNHLQQLKIEIDSYDIDEIEKSISAIEAFKNFIHSIPLFGGGYSSSLTTTQNN